MSHFNTTHEDGETLIQYGKLSETQAKHIESLFTSYRRMTPSQAWRAMNQPDTPLTSVRRAISNLSRDGILIKTGIKAVGIYGRPEYFWEMI